MSINFQLASVLHGVCVGLIAFLIGRQVARLRFDNRKYAVQVPLLFKLFLPLARIWAPKIRKNDSLKGWMEHADQRLTMAGLQQAYTPEEFVGLRLIIGIVLSIIGAIFMAIGTRVTAAAGVIFMIAAWFYPTLWLTGVIKMRHKQIQKALPNILDLLTLSVEAGRDFLTAMKDILQNREPDPLGDELEQVFREVQLGKQRRHALQAMAERARQPDLDTVVETLVQADTLGVSIGHILRVLGDQMRQKRFSAAEKMANESPVKLLFPLFIFIFPAVLIIMLGPILLKALQQNVF